MIKIINAICGKLSFQWKQPTTKAGLIGLLSVAGIGLSPEWTEIIFVIGGGIVSLIFLLTSERPDKPIVEDVTKEKK
jgi:hypothetical protein